MKTLKNFKDLKTSEASSTGVLEPCVVLEWKETRNIVAIYGGLHAVRIWTTAECPRWPHAVVNIRKQFSRGW